MKLLDVIRRINIGIRGRTPFSEPAAPLAHGAMPGGMSAAHTASAPKPGLYARLSPRRRQYLHMTAAGLALAAAALVVSSFVGMPDSRGPSPLALPKSRPLGGVPGSQLESRDAWMGGAGKEIARMRDELRRKDEQLAVLQGDLRQTREGLRAELEALRQRVPGATASASPAAAAGPSLQLPLPGSALPVVPAPTFSQSPRVLPGAVTPPSPASPVGAVGAVGAAGRGAELGPVVNGPAVFPAQRGRPAEARAVPGLGYPPGTPLAAAAPSAMTGLTAGAEVPPAAQTPVAVVPVLVRMSATGASFAASSPSGGAGSGGMGGMGGGGGGGGGGTAAPVAQPRRVGAFLPVGFTRAVLLGGLAAPTGGQAQSNPIPVLARLADLAVLPNGFRARVKDCLVVGEGYGDASAERAYVRTTLLSCVMRDGRVLEVPIKGSMFGEDGMNGVMGKLVTKQGAILQNAFIAGIASGLGTGVMNASQAVTTTALGAITTGPTDAASLLRQGLGSGVGKALDRLSQYYINLAERTFPVIEVQPGRFVDIVIQQGARLDVAVAALGPEAAEPAAPRGGAPDADRSALMDTLHDTASPDIAD